MVYLGLGPAVVQKFRYCNRLMRLDLIKSVIDGLSCPAGKRDFLVFDAKLPGFGLRINESGSKIFLVQYSRAGRTRRVKIGRFGVITATEARRKALELIAGIQAGGDPVEAREKERAAAIKALADRERLALAQRQAEEFTVSVLLDSWVAIKLKDHSLAYRAEAPAGVRRLLGKVLTASPAASVTTAAVQLIIDREIARAPVQAIDARAYGRAAWNWAIQRGLVVANPFTGVMIEHRVKSRDRVLTEAELAQVWRATESKPYPFGPVIRLLILTLQRRSEVTGMCWSELAPDLSCWTIPASRSKNRRAHNVHLSQPARDILKALRRRQDDAVAATRRQTGIQAPDVDFIFTTTGSTPVSGMEKARRSLDPAADTEFDSDNAHGVRLVHGPTHAKGRMRRKRQSPDDWRFHDFRRTGVSKMAELGISPHVADRILNHVSGAISGVAAVYQRYEFLPERKNALDVWAAHVLAITRGGGLDSNVVTIGRKKRSTL